MLLISYLQFRTKKNMLWKIPSFNRHSVWFAALVSRKSAEWEVAPSSSGYLIATQQLVGWNVKFLHDPPVEEARTLLTLSETLSAALLFKVPTCGADGTTAVPRIHFTVWPGAIRPLIFSPFSLQPGPSTILEKKGKTSDEPLFKFRAAAPAWLFRPSRGRPSFVIAFGELTNTSRESAWESGLKRAFELQAPDVSLIFLSEA